MTVSLVGKYVKLHDSYLSIAEALRHAGWENGVRVNINWIDSESLTRVTAPKLFGRNRRYPGTRRFWDPRYGRDDSGGGICKDQ